MSYDENWPRWVQASINVHFDTLLPPDLKKIYEGQPRDINTKNDLVELRLDGPDGIEVSKDYWLHDVEINALIQSISDNKNLYRHGLIIGQVAAAFTTSILVKKCGDQPTDDQSPVGCLILKQVPGKDMIEVSRFGLIEPSTPMEQTTIEGHYRMTLSTS